MQIFLLYTKKRGLFEWEGFNERQKCCKRNILIANTKLQATMIFSFFSYLDKSAADIKSNTKFIIIIKKNFFFHLIFILFHSTSFHIMLHTILYSHQCIIKIIFMRKVLKKHIPLNFTTRISLSEKYTELYSEEAENGD